jgi:hypothetical protein
MVPQDQFQEQSWSFAHMACHRDFVSVVLVKYNIVLPEYAIDPFGDDVADVHQQMHNDLDPILGVHGFDLTEVNWKDPAQRKAWIWLNATLHQQEGTVLGVG